MPLHLSPPLDRLRSQCRCTAGELPVVLPCRIPLCKVHPPTGLRTPDSRHHLGSISASADYQPCSRRRPVVVYTPTAPSQQGRGSFTARLWTAGACCTPPPHRLAAAPLVRPSPLCTDRLACFTSVRAPVRVFDATCHAPVIPRLQGAPWASSCCCALWHTAAVRAAMRAAISLTVHHARSLRQCFLQA